MLPACSNGLIAKYVRRRCNTSKIGYGLLGGKLSVDLKVKECYI